MTNPENGFNEEPSLDFEAFQAQLERDELSAIVSKEKIRAIEERVDLALVEFDVEHVTRANHEVIPEYAEEFFQVYESALHDSYSEEGYYPESEEITVLAERLLKQRCIEEAGIITAVKMFITAGEDAPPSQQELLTDKKFTLIADWMTRQDYGHDSAWVQFLNEVLPGESFTEENSSTYLINAIEKVANEKAQNEKYQKLLSSAAEHIDRELDEPLSVAFVSLFTIALRRDAHSEADFSAAIDEKAREHGLDPKIAEEAIKYFLQHIDQAPN